MGGDHAPKAVLEGVEAVLPELHASGHQLTLFGPKAILEEPVGAWARQGMDVRVHAAEEVIGMGDSPTRSFQQKPDSSICRAFESLRAGEIDVFLSAGNTGAVLVGALYSIGAIEGVSRPPITTMVPKEDGSFGVMLDVGANSDCKQDTLHQFGVLGSMYLKNVFGVDAPKVALLSLGSEPEKGNRVTQAAYALMEADERIRFVGNIEGYDLFSNKADVVVCDGFTGNAVLKVAETIFQMFRRRGYHDEYLQKFDYETYGGTPVLGVRRPVIIGHGVSSPAAFRKMILLARDVVQSNLTEKIHTAFQSTATP